MKTILAAAVAAALTFAAAAPALGQSAGAKAAQAREANFKQLGGAAKAINDALKADTPDLSLIRANALKADQLAAQLGTWFPRGSGAESGVEVETRPEIWSDAAGFAAEARALKVETAKLAQLSAGGDVDGLKTQTRAVGGACKSCHDKFRLKK